MLALAADLVFARRGVVLNPHYKGMGGLYGSEYWTYCLPRRVGANRAVQLTERLQPIGVRHAKSIGFLDDAFGETVEEFERELEVRMATLAADPHLWRKLIDKHERRLADERIKPLDAYRDEELEKMWVNFFGPDPSYHEARRRFVFKGKSPAQVPSQHAFVATPQRAACA
jgi:putative two-component system hydrogenase maturation factor HypX/HoxX